MSVGAQQSQVQPSRLVKEITHGSKSSQGWLNLNPGLTFK